MKETDYSAANEKPFFSVITVCYNSEKWIECALESMLQQTFGDYEYIIIDGASRDRTLEIIETYKEKFTGKLKLVSEPDRGIYDAMNKGIRMASGTVVGILNSDDYYEPEALEIIHREYDPEKPYQILYGMIHIVDPKGTLKKIFWGSHQFINEQPVVHPACFITNKLYKDKGLYSLEYRYASDYDFLMRMTRDSEVLFKPVFKVLSNFREGGQSEKPEATMEHFRVLRENGVISDEKCKREIGILRMKNSMKHLFRRK